MDMTFSGELPTMKGPATYVISVQGRLDPKWSDRLGGMGITLISGTRRKEISILQGRVTDQAALSGILNTLYELQMPVLSVECLDAK